MPASDLGDFEPTVISVGRDLGWIEKFHKASR